VDTKDGVDPETKADTVTDRKEATRAGDPKVSGVDMVDQVVMDHKEADPREDLMVDLKEAMATGTGMVPAHNKVDPRVLEDLRVVVTCMVAEVLARRAAVPPVVQRHQVPVEPLRRLRKKRSSTAAAVVAMVDTTEMVTAVVTAWKVIKAIEVVMHRTAVRKGTARAQVMVTRKECLLQVV